MSAWCLEQPQKAVALDSCFTRVPAAGDGFDKAVAACTGVGGFLAAPSTKEAFEAVVASFSVT